MFEWSFMTRSISISKGSRMRNYFWGEVIHIHPIGINPAEKLKLLILLLAGLISSYLIIRRFESTYFPIQFVIQFDSGNHHLPLLWLGNADGSLCGKLRHTTFLHPRRLDSIRQSEVLVPSSSRPQQSIILYPSPSKSMYQVFGQNPTLISITIYVIITYYVLLIPNYRTNNNNNRRHFIIFIKSYIEPVSRTRVFTCKCALYSRSSYEQTEHDVREYHPRSLLTRCAVRVARIIIMNEMSRLAF